MRKMYPKIKRVAFAVPTVPRAVVTRVRQLHSHEADATELRSARVWVDDARGSRETRVMFRNWRKSD